MAAKDSLDRISLMKRQAILKRRTGSSPRHSFHLRLSCQQCMIIKTMYPFYHQIVSSKNHAGVTATKMG